MERDVIERLTQVVTGDATYRTLTGWSTSDPRWYFYHLGDAVIDATRPAYITYMMPNASESTSGVRAPVVSCMIWGRTRNAVLAVRERLADLLDKKTHTTGSSRKVRTRIVNEQDAFDGATSFVGRQVQIRAAYLD